MMVRAYDGDFHDQTDGIENATVPTQRIHALTNALAVLVLCPETRVWLKSNDPMALEQAEAALALAPDGDDILALAAEVDLRELRRSYPLVQEEDGDVAWVCRLGAYHDYNKHDDEDCPHMRAHDEDYCSACAPYQCHHEHDHP